MSEIETNAASGNQRQAATRATSPGPGCSPLCTRCVNGVYHYTHLTGCVQCRLYPLTLNLAAANKAVWRMGTFCIPNNAARTCPQYQANPTLHRGANSERE